MAEESEFHSFDEIRAYIKSELERKLTEEQQKVAIWRLAKQSMWFLLLVVAYLQYYFLDILTETMTLPTLEVTVPITKSSTTTRT